MCGLNVKTFHKTKTCKSSSLLSLSFEFALEILKLDHLSEIYWAVLSVELFVMLYKIVFTFDSVYAILQCNHSDVNVSALCDGYTFLVISSLVHYFLVQCFDVDCQTATWNFRIWVSDNNDSPFNLCLYMKTICAKQAQSGTLRLFFTLSTLHAKFYLKATF